MFYSLKDALRDETVAGNIFNCVAAYVGVNNDMLKGLNEMFIKFLMNSHAGLV